MRKGSNYGKYSLKYQSENIKRPQECLVLFSWSSGYLSKSKWVIIKRWCLATSYDDRWFRKIIWFSATWRLLLQVDCRTGDDVDLSYSATNITKGVWNNPSEQIYNVKSHIS